jgi:hypothetical protein
MIERICGWSEAGRISLQKLLRLGLKMIRICASSCFAKNDELLYLVIGANRDRSHYKIC